MTMRGMCMALALLGLSGLGSLSAASAADGKSGAGGTNEVSATGAVTAVNAVNASAAVRDAPPAAADAAEAAQAQETRKLHALFDRQWQDTSRRVPEYATYRGDYRYNDRLGDVSPAAQAEFDAQTRIWLAEARTIRRERLNASDRISLDMFIGAREREVLFQQFAGYRSLRIGSLDGVQTGLASLMRVVPMQSPAQVQQLLTRLAAFPRRMDQEIDRLRSGVALGWVASRDVLERALRQIDAELPADTEAGPFYRPFKHLGPEITAAEQARLQAAGRAAIERDVLPAMHKLRAFIVEDYLPHAPRDGALAHYPDGARVYAALVAQQTTTALSPAQIHAIGLREMARIRTEMEAVMRQTKFDGDFAAFVKFLDSDPRFFFDSPEALLAGYRDIAKRIDAELPRLFAELPRAPYGVRAMPSFNGPDAAEYYDSPASDGSRAGYFNAAATGFAKKPKWSMPTLVAHEAVPGHHLQIARALELKNLPEFRRSGYAYTAFIEGWALYAETLGNRIGLYDDPYDHFGHLQGQALRAARLVVDTGIHAMGWSRQQAIDYMVERTGEHPDFIASEVDRYISQPAQALGYMIGELKIIELRERAQAALGARSDLRRFDNAVIDQGALPLDTLEHVIDDWIAGQH